MKLGAAGRPSQDRTKQRRCRPSSAPRLQVTSGPRPQVADHLLSRVTDYQGKKWRWPWPLLDHFLLTVLLSGLGTPAADRETKIRGQVIDKGLFSGPPSRKGGSGEGGGRVCCWRGRGRLAAPLSRTRPQAESMGPLSGHWLLLWEDALPPSERFSFSALKH